MDIPRILLEQTKALVSSNAAKKHSKTYIPKLPEGKFDKIKKPVSDHFTFGFAQETVMPEDKIPGKKKYYVAGYRINNPAVGVLDDLQAKALWIDDNSGRGGVVFAVVDCVGLFGVDVAEIRNRLGRFCADTKCRSVNIFATHCHAGIDTMGMWGPLPRSGRDKDFMEIVYNGVVKAVKKAYANRTDGQIYLGKAKADEGWQRDQRPPEVFSDVITRLRFVPDDGSDETYFINFATHPESLEGKNSLVSADIPCYMAKYVKEHKNANMMFFPGAIGAMCMHPFDDNNIISTMKTGQMIGEKICKIKKETKLRPMINILRQETYLTCENPVFWLASKINIIPEPMVITGKGELNLGMKTELSYIQLGSLNMLLIPGEIFPELVYGGYLSEDESGTGKSPDINPEPLCEIADDDDLLVFGLANGEIGYIVTPNDFVLDNRFPYINQAKDKNGRNHYHETNSLNAITAYEIADTVKSMIEIVKK